MRNLALLVMGLRGRWPDDPPCRFNSRQIEAEVTPEPGGTYIVRLDSHECPEFWMELCIKLLPNE